MKAFLSAGAIVLVLCGCHASQEISVGSMKAELVRIDTVYRYDRHEQVLTWKSENNVEFESYAAIGPVFKLGSTVTVFVKK